MKKRIAFIIYTISLWLLMIRQMSGMMANVPYFSQIASVYGQKILLLGITLAGVSILLQTDSLKEIVICVVVCALSVLASVPSENTMLPILVFLVVGARKFEKRKLVLTWLIPVIPIVILPTLYSFIHWETSNYCIMDTVGRCKFYFNHSNSYGLWFTFAIFGIVYLLFSQKKQYICYIILLLASIFLLVYPNCKTDAIILMAAIPLLIVYLHFPRLWKIVLYCVPLVCVGITIFLTLIYYFGVIPVDQKIIHDTFSMRFQDAAVLLHLCPISAVGQSVPFLGGNFELYGVVRNAISLDNAYVAATIYYGCFIGGIIIVWIVRQIFELGKCGDREARMNANMLLLIFVMGMMEWPAWYGTIGFPMLFLGESEKNKGIIA